VDVRRLAPDDVSLVAAIDRSEHVDTEYRVVDGQLLEVRAKFPDIPAWDREGSGPHSVSATIAFCRDAVGRGGVLLGSFDGDRVRGLAVVVPRFEPPLAWFAFLSVTRCDRRRGVAQTLWDATVVIAQREGATRMYVSAAPTESAVGFYLRQGCQLADPVHAELFAHEPDDIHLVCTLS
jgi:ribosomal protein S18 acetylase RimI-like enzyme